MNSAIVRKLRVKPSDVCAPLHPNSRAIDGVSMPASTVDIGVKQKSKATVVDASIWKAPGSDLFLVTGILGTSGT